MDDRILYYESGVISALLARSRRTLLSGIRFSLCAGESMALIGETGSGKTMTALSLMGLLPGNVTMTGGSVRFLGRELSEEPSLAPWLGKEIVYIPQNGLEFLNPAASVRSQLSDSLKKLGVPKKEREARLLEALRLSGFDEPGEIAGKYPFQLSGGMAQRVTIALSLCSEAKLILADEPTNGLDEESRTNFLTLLRTLFPEAAQLIITHDIGIAELCDSVLVLCGGREMEYGPSEEVLRSPRQPYTRALLGALVKNGLQQTPRLRQSEGDCPFYDRCPHAGADCLSPVLHTEGRREWRCRP